MLRVALFSFLALSAVARLGSQDDFNFDEESNPGGQGSQTITISRSLTGDSCTLLIKETNFKRAAGEPVQDIECQADDGIVYNFTEDSKDALQSQGFISGDSSLQVDGSFENATDTISLESDGSFEVSTVDPGSSRRLAVSGDRSVLVVRVIAIDAATTASVDTLRDKVFGTNGDLVNLKSQMSACSYGKVSFVPAPSISSSGIISGVVEVSINMQVLGAPRGDVMNAVTAALNAKGILQAHYNHFMYALPSGTAGSWLAYAYVNARISVYNDKWVTFVSGQMHEIGHNLGMAHSGEAGQAYADQTGLMGYSYGLDNGPLMCFNPAKSFQLGWYSSRQVVVDPLTIGWSGNLVGIVDYYIGIASDQTLIKINTNTAYDYYVMFNRKAGFNAGTQEGGNQVVVTAQGGEGAAYATSDLVAKLSAGGVWTLANFNGSGLTLRVTVGAINLLTSPAIATVTVAVDGGGVATPFVPPVAPPFAPPVAQGAAPPAPPPPVATPPVPAPMPPPQPPAQCVAVGQICNAGGTCCAGTRCRFKSPNKAWRNRCK